MNKAFAKIQVYLLPFIELSELKMTHIRDLIVFNYIEIFLKKIHIY